LKRYFASIIIIIIFTLAALGFLGGCEKPRQTAYPSEDTLSAGIFLDPETERVFLAEGVEIRKIYDRGIELTRESEGFRGRLYNDVANYCAIGYGHLIKLAPCDGNESSEFRAGISESRATEILRQDLEKAQRGIMTLVGAELTDGQYAALCDFVFNVGVGNFRKSTLRKRVNAGDFDRVPFEFRRWIYVDGRKLSGLAKRREKEIKLFFEEIGVPRAIPPVDVDLSPIDIRSGEVGT